MNSMHNTLRPRSRPLLTLWVLGAAAGCTALAAQTRPARPAAPKPAPVKKSAAADTLNRTKKAAAPAAATHQLSFAAQEDVPFSVNRGKVYAFFDANMKTSVLELTLDGAPLKAEDGKVTWTVVGDDPNFKLSKALFLWGDQMQGPLEGIRAQINLNSPLHDLVVIKATLTPKNGGQPVSAELRVQVLADTASDLTITASDSAGKDAATTALTLKPQQEQTLKVAARSQGKSVTARVVWHLEAEGDLPVKFESSGGTVSDDNGDLVLTSDAAVTIKGLQAGTAKLIVSSSNGTATSMKITVSAPVVKLTTKPDTLTLHKDETGSITAALTDTAGNIIPGELEWKIDDPNIVTDEDAAAADAAKPAADDATKPADTTKRPTRRIRGVKPGTTTLTVSYKNSDGNPTTASTAITVLPATMIAIYGQSAVVKGQTIKLTVDFPNATKSELDQLVLTNEDLITNPNNDQTPLITARIDPEDPARRRILVTGVNSGYALLQIKTKTPGGTVLQTSIPLTVAAVSYFRKLKVSMDIMDEQTASDLFGSVASRDFYVGRVRLFNNLHQDPSGNSAGDSLLAYSSSIEAGVILEKRYDRKLGTFIPKLSEAAKRSLWERVTEKDVEDKYGRALDNEENSASQIREQLRQPKTVPDYTIALGNLKGNNPTLYVDKGEQIKQITITQPDGKVLNPQRLQWSSSRPEIAGVNNLGIVTGREAGTTVITATDPDGSNGMVYAIEVIVDKSRDDPQIYSRLIASEQLSINQAMTLSVQGITWTTPSDKPRKLKWYSTNPYIVEVVTADKLRDNKLNTAANSTQASSNASARETRDNSFNALTGTESPVDTSTPDDPNKCLIRALYPGTALIVAVEDIEETADGKTKTSPNSSRVVFARLVRVPQPESRTLPPSVIVRDGELIYLRDRFRYRPYSYELMVNTVDSRDIRSVRSQGFQWLSLIGAIAGVVAPMTKGGSPTVGDAAAAYNGAFLPALQKLFPSMNETQRQNIVNMTMRPIEEVPFGSDINRVLFFPKKQFSGLLPGYWTRVGKVDTSYFNIMVAVVKKAQQTTETATGSTTQP